ncbi:MAG: hypothetical protein ACXADU_00350 [Promethearchaeota archaeon]|jgi:hypothetical protein
MGNNLTHSEMECYQIIFDSFQCEKASRERLELWKNRALIKLMKLLENKRNRILVTNAIILLLSLCEDFPPDNYNTHGADINSLSSRNKKFLIDDLRNEFLPN